MRNDREKTTSFNYPLQPTTPKTTRRQRGERNGPRLFGLGTEEFDFAAASSLGCRATHIPLSAPRFAISSSQTHLYYFSRSRIVVLSLYQLSIRSNSHLRHLPCSTFQVSRLLPPCSEYLKRSVESRYTTVLDAVGHAVAQVSFRGLVSFLDDARSLSPPYLKKRVDYPAALSVSWGVVRPCSSEFVVPVSRSSVWGVSSGRSLLDLVIPDPMFRMIRMRMREGRRFSPSGVVRSV